jgi:hypothetical protein
MRGRGHPQHPRCAPCEVLAAHAWAHDPLGHLRQLLDIAIVAADADPSELRRLAVHSGVSDVWDATVAALNALFGQSASHAEAVGSPPRSVRGRTVFEAHLHLTSWLSLWSYSRLEDLSAGTAALAADLWPLPEEQWRDSRLALGWQ